MAAVHLPGAALEIDVSGKELKDLLQRSLQSKELLEVDVGEERWLLNPAQVLFVVDDGQAGRGHKDWRDWRGGWRKRPLRGRLLADGNEKSGQRLGRRE